MRSAGIYPDAQNPIQDSDIEWAERIFFIGSKSEFEFNNRFMHIQFKDSKNQQRTVKSLYENPSLIYLDIPDPIGFNQDVKIETPDPAIFDISNECIEQLKKVVLEKLQPYLGTPLTSEEVMKSFSLRF